MARQPSRVIETRYARYQVAWIPLPQCPIPGWSACHIQAIDSGRPTAPAIRLTLYERLEPEQDGNAPGAA